MRLLTKEIKMTKQEIQEYRGVISTLIDVRQGDKMLEKVLSVSLKALDIAEKHVWLPISEAPKDGAEVRLKNGYNTGTGFFREKEKKDLWVSNGYDDEKDISCEVEFESGYCGGIFGLEVTRYKEDCNGEWCSVNDDPHREIVRINDSAIKPTHYMPLPTPPRV